MDFVWLSVVVGFFGVSGLLLQGIALLKSEK